MNAKDATARIEACIDELTDMNDVPRPDAIEYLELLIDTAQTQLDAMREDEEREENED